MPSSTEKQARTMAAAAHDPEFAKKVGIPQSVAKDFNKADTGTALLSKSAQRRHTLYDHPRSRKGYAAGGKVGDSPPLTEEEMKGWNEFLQEKARQNAKSYAEGGLVKGNGEGDWTDNLGRNRPLRGDADPKMLKPPVHAEPEEKDKGRVFTPDVDQTDKGRPTGPYAEGGKIKRTAGPAIGRDDGLIPAQKGEFVVKKSAVKKLGDATLEEINKGRLPRHSALYDHPTSRRHAKD
jgi:hypothetical protein